MTNAFYEDDDPIFAIRRNVQDKLTYKNIISSAIMRCNFSRGTNQFKYDVQALASTIRFNVTGYNLAKELNEIEKNLVYEKKRFIDHQNNLYGIKLRFHANQAKLKIKTMEWFWNTYYENILQLLASHNLLFDTEKRIPVIQDRSRDEEGI